MTHSWQNDEQQSDYYLDRLMSPGQRQVFEARWESEPELRAEVERDAVVVDALRRSFFVPPVPEGFLAAEVQQADAVSSVAGGAARQRRHVLPLAVAAGLLWALVVWQLWPAGKAQPKFTSLPLTQVYEDTLNGGFKPYYFCEDDARFAATFAKRQGQALHLDELPADRRMLGLDYPGGLSRDATSILCEIDDQPVLIFVDRQENEVADLVQPGVLSDATRIHIHRRELGDLVLFEISPLAKPAFLNFLRLGDE